MEASVLLFCLGAAITSLFVVGIIWPLRRYIHSLPFRKQSSFIIVASLFLSILGIIIISIVIYLIVEGFYSEAGSNTHKRYVFLTSSYVSQIALGALVGPIILFWLLYFVSEKPTDEQKRLRTSLTIAVCVLLLFSLLLPYMNRWLANATSFEIAQIAKITIDARQVAQIHAPPSFVAGPAAESASVDFKGDDIIDALGQIVAMTSHSDQRGMMDRDEKYLTLTRSAGERYARDLNEYLDNDRHFLNILRPLATCLKQYATEFHDYRLFLIDIKPLLVTLTVIARADQVPQPRKLLELLDSQIVSLQRNAAENLAYKAQPISAECTSHIDVANFRPEKGNYLPYKTIALAFFLSAIGSADTAIVELGDWIASAPEVGYPKWYKLRAKLEQNYLLERVLPGGFRNAVYRRFVADLVREFADLLPQQDLKKWAEKCNKEVYESELVFVYMVQVNMLIKASSNLDDIDSDIVEKANVNKQIDLSCFKSTSHAEEIDAWRAEFLTTYASALLVSSYDERLYGRGEHPEQKRLREISRKDLFDATNILREVVKKTTEEIKELPQAKQIFARPRWEDTLKTARAAMRTIVDTAK